MSNESKPMSKEEQIRKFLREERIIRLEIQDEYVKVIHGYLDWESKQSSPITDDIKRLAGKYAEEWEKFNGFGMHPKTASFQGYLAGFAANNSEAPKADVKFDDTMYIQFPGVQGSDINAQSNKEELSNMFKNIVDAESLLKEYWELINTKPVEQYKDEHRAWFKKMENYMKGMPKADVKSKEEIFLKHTAGKSYYDYNDIMASHEEYANQFKSPQA